ncbi:MAG TPA: hypothetical protein VHN78_02590, partial [Chloroflexota bacterium]|nr:hypothetical protein [Chloroflexota bacterium]
MAQARPLWDDHRQPAGLTRSRGAVRARWRLGYGLVAAAVLACLIAAGLAVRLWVLGTGDELNADEVLPGLMAWHILTKGERPVFYYGQHYFGAVEAYILAGLFAWRGFDPWLAVVPPLACSLAQIPITYALARHLTGRGGSVVATLAVAIPPPVLAKLYANPGGGFSLAFALHGAALLCFLRAYLSTGAGWPPTLWAMAFSFLAGILCWVWQPALVLYPALVLMIVLRGPAWRRPGRLVGVVAPVLCGLIPPLSYNISAGWPTV